MLKKYSPKQLWDDCLELQGFITSNTAGNHFGLNGETPETMLSGETADISEFAEYGWYDWVKFCDTNVPYPEDKLVLGQYYMWTIWNQANPKFNNQFEQWLQTNYGQHRRVLNYRAKVHKSLVMEIDYAKRGKVIFGMIEHVKNMVNDLPKKLKSTDIA